MQHQTQTVTGLEKNAYDLVVYWRRLLRGSQLFLLSDVSPRELFFIGGYFTVKAGLKKNYTQFSVQRGQEKSVSECFWGGKNVREHHIVSWVEMQKKTGECARGEDLTEKGKEGKGKYALICVRRQIQGLSM